MNMPPASDRQEIAELLVDFCHAADALGDGAAITALFEDDAVYDLTGFGMAAFTGAEAIRGFFAGSFASTERNVHFISNIRVHKGDAGRAAASAYVHAFSHTSDGGQLELRARYDVEVSRRTGRWRFSRMGIAVLPV